MRHVLSHAREDGSHDAELWKDAYGCVYRAIRRGDGVYLWRGLVGPMPKLVAVHPREAWEAIVADPCPYFVEVVL